MYDKVIHVINHFDSLPTSRDADLLGVLKDLSNNSSDDDGDDDDDNLRI